MKNKLAVAMSIYKSDKLEYVRESIGSITDQSYSFFDLFIEVDGPISTDVELYLRSLSNLDNVYVNYNSSNMGLARRLNDIIDKVLKKGCYTFLARMDADDISFPQRFERQIEYLNNHSEVAVVGSDVVEISEIGHELFYKRMDALHDEISRNIIKKCPFNHPSVVFRMAIFEEGFRYKSELMNTQDYYLWVDLLAAGKKFANINEPLLKFRVNNSFHSRRGFKKAMNDLNSRIYAFKKLDTFNLGNVIHTVSLFLLRIAPTSIKKWAYSTLR